MIATRWSRRAACAALIVGLSVMGAATSGSAQTVPSPTDTPTPVPAGAPAVTTDTPTPVPPAAPAVTTDTPTPVPAVDPAVTDTPTPVAAVDPVVTDTPIPAPTPTVTPTVFSSGVPCATDAPAAERVQRSERRGEDEDGVGDRDEFRTGNGTNEVVVHNCTDNRLRVRAAIQLNTIPGRVVTPLNEAYAEGSCLHCQTLAVALQIDLYSAERATDIEPGNFAVAINTGCTGCVTVARAIQYVQGVDEPGDVSEEISSTVNALSNELTAIQSDPSVTLPEAESRLNAVIARFNALGGSLLEQRDERDD
jgi:hypothetical protein